MILTNSQALPEFVDQRAFGRDVVAIDPGHQNQSLIVGAEAEHLIVRFFRARPHCRLQAGEFLAVGELARRRFLGQLAAGVDLGDVKRLQTAQGVAMIFVDEAGENVIGIMPGANAELSIEDAERTLGALGPADVLVVQQEIAPGSTITA